MRKGIKIKKETIQPLITAARFDERISPPDDGDINTSFDKDEKKFMTAISRIDLSKPIEEETIKRYSDLVRHIMKHLNKTEDDTTLDYVDFKAALDITNVQVLESRTMALYKVTAIKKRQVMDENDLEIALMINDSYPAHSSFLSTYELFSTFDINMCGSLDFEQFKECVNTLSYEEGSNPKDPAFLAYLFRKSAQQGKIDFNTFVSLWCSKIADVKHVLGRRGLMKQHRSRDTIMSISGLFSSVWKYFQLKDILQDEMTKPGYDIITQFDKVRQRIVDMRIELQRRKDKERRVTKIITRKQKRKGVISASQHKRQVSLILQNEGAKTIKMIEENHLLREKIMKDCEDSKLKIDLEYHEKKQEKLKKELLDIQRTSADRLILRDEKLDEIPSSLYSNQESKLKLSDVKILDLSQNFISCLPSIGFFFHLTSLRKLSLSRNKLEEISDEISCLTSLEILRVEENHITSMPSKLHYLQSLQILDVSNNKLSAFQEELCGLENLKILKLQFNQMVELPSSIGDLKSLQSIDLSNNRLTKLPESFCALKCLVHVNISNNGVTILPFHFGRLQKLEDLNMSYNSLKHLPESFSNLKKLRQINVKYNNLTEWGNSMEGLENLESFEGMKNECLKVSTKIGSFVSLQRFSLPINLINSLPPEIGLLKSLMHLDLHGNQIEELPLQIGALNNLKYLDISQNQILSFPHEFCLLKSLLILNASCNNLESLPQHIGSLRNLRIIKFGNNKLSRLPASFQKLDNIEELDLSYNMMGVITKEFCENLKALKVANLRSNRIQYLPIEICNMNSLQILNLRQNKLNSLPLEILTSEIELDITQNPLKDLPFKFHMTVQKDYIQENPSGYTQVEVQEWMKNEKLMYQPAVDEWNMKMTFYLSGNLGFDDFKNGVIWRCDNILDGFDSNVFKDDEKIIKRLTQFYFHCKKYGNPPLYIQRKVQEDEKRQSDARQIDNKREKRMNIARNIDFKRREEEHERYFGNFQERCNEAESRIRTSQDNMLESKRKDNMALLNDVAARIIVKEKKEAKELADREKALSLESERLNSISFKMHKSKKRFLPVESIPCWKAHNEET